MVPAGLICDTLVFDEVDAGVMELTAVVLAEVLASSLQNTSGQTHTLPLKHRCCYGL